MRVNVIRMRLSEPLPRSASRPRADHHPHLPGHRCRAVAHLPCYRVGIPVRRVPEVIRVLTGVAATQGGITQDALCRLASPVGDA